MSKKVLKIRYKDKRKFGSKLVLSRNSKEAGKHFNNRGRILKISKVSHEELFKVGEYFPAEELMRELGRTP